jgi:ankyrin repeat protein
MSINDLDAQTRQSLRDSFFRAARLGELDNLRTIITNYPDMLDDKVSSTGATALVLAAENGHIRSVKFLLEQGADIDAVDTVGRNALFMAAKYGKANIVQLLIGMGQDPYLVQDGASPHIIARTGGFNVLGEDIIKWRKEWLADVEKVKASADAAQRKQVTELTTKIRSGTATAVAAPTTARFRPKF